MSLNLSAFDPIHLPESTKEFRREIDAFLNETLPQYPTSQRAKTWSNSVHSFSQALAEKGWLGLTWPKSFGGQERTMLDRFVLTEQLLARGAPCGWHWVADRQSGPLLMRYGNASQHDLVPKIAKAEVNFCIGMSEPDSGSDLASIKASAKETDQGWVLNGQKVWTSGGHSATHMIGLFRTDPDKPKHEGISQFVIDLEGPGITRRPIRNMSGEDHFSEVFFEEALIPHEALLGERCGGWKQVMGELVYERSGPERFISYFYLLSEMMATIKTSGKHCPFTTLGIGQILSRAIALRSMSKTISHQLQEGKTPSLEASIVKDRGAELEAKIPELLALWPEVFQPVKGSGVSELQKSFNWMLTDQFSISLRGGTKEILRGIIARGLGLR